MILNARTRSAEPTRAHVMYVARDISVPVLLYTERIPEATTYYTTHE